MNPPHPPAANAYAFGDYRVEVARRILLQRGEAAPLTPKAFDTLLELVRHHGELVEKDALMQAVWPGRVVEENNLNQSIAVLRRVLQDRRGENRYIETVSGRGYRFVGEVKVVEPLRSDQSAITVAVLPIENRTGEAKHEYLADGLTEEAIAALSRVEPKRVSVISRAAVMAYKQTTDSVDRVGRELGATHLVQGSLHLDEGRARVTATLFRARDQTQLWTATFDSEPAGVLEFQCALASAVAHQAHHEVEPSWLAALAIRQSRNADAFHSYLRGRQAWHLLTPASTRQALEHFSRAAKQDPDYALAWSGIADAYGGMPMTGDAPPREVTAPATEASERALRAQPDLAAVQASVGFRKFRLDWDWAGAEVALRRATELDPTYWFAFATLGHLHSHRGEVPESLAAMRRSRELEPLLPLAHTMSAHVAFAARDFVLAAQFARQALSIDAEFWIGYSQLAQACVELGEYEAAQRALADAGRTSGGNSKVVSLQGYLHARQGREAEAQQVLATLVALTAERYMPPCAIALVHVGLGDISAAALWLQRAFEARDVHLMFIPIDPKWDEARKDPRIDAVLRQCGFAPRA